jgi:hypothetical protein
VLDEHCIIRCVGVIMSARFGIQRASDPHIARLLEEVEAGQQSWIEGTGDTSPLRSQHEEMTIFGPFGGRRSGAAVGPGQAAVNAVFHGGASKVEVANVIESGGLVVLALWVTCDVRFAGREEPHRWNLRVTEVYERVGEGWVRLHRHADPLQGFRTLEETLALVI